MRPCASESRSKPLVRRNNSRRALKSCGGGLRGNGDPHVTLFGSLLVLPARLRSSQPPSLPTPSRRISVHRHHAFKPLIRSLQPGTRHNFRWCVCLLPSRNSSCARVMGELRRIVSQRRECLLSVPTRLTFQQGTHSPHTRIHP